MGADTAIINRLTAPHLWSSGSTAPGLAVDSVEGIVQPAGADLYQGELLRADGIMGYLSFAAGSYTLAAYGVIGHSCGSSSSACTLTPDGTTTGSGTLNTNARTIADFAATKAAFTLEDQKTYNLVAYGLADWNSAGSASWAPTVSLALTEESSGVSAPFAQASLRFMHAVAKYSTSSISVYGGRSVAAASSLATISFGSVSDWTAVPASQSYVFPISVGGTSVAQSTTVTLDVRAGTRATVICAVNDLNLATVFCRQIPSRVVAYVRLVNALGSSDTLQVPDVWTGVKASESNLSLVGSYATATEYLATAAIQPDAAANMQPPAAAPTEVYSIVSGVTASTISGYGDVHVPLAIMDLALSPRISIRATNQGPTGGAGTVPTTVAIGIGAATQAGFVESPYTTMGGTTLYNQNHMNPMYKRVTMAIRSAGGRNMGHEPTLGTTGTVFTGAAISYGSTAAAAAHGSDEAIPIASGFTMAAGSTGPVGARTDAQLGIVSATTATAVVGSATAPAHIKIITAARTVTTTGAYLGWRVHVTTGSAKTQCHMDGYTGTIVADDNAGKSFYMLPTVNRVTGKSVATPEDTAGDCLYALSFGVYDDIFGVPLAAQFAEPGTAMSVAYGYSNRFANTAASCTTAVTRATGFGGDFEISIGVDFGVEQFAVDRSTIAQWALLPTSRFSNLQNAGTAAAGTSKFVVASVSNGVVSSGSTTLNTIATGLGTNANTAIQLVTGTTDAINAWSVAGFSTAVQVGAAGAAGERSSAAGGGGVSAISPSGHTPTAFNTLSAGAFQVSTSATPTAVGTTWSVCYEHVPSHQFSVEAGGIYSTHVLNQDLCVCSSATYATTGLTAATVKWGYASAPAAATTAAAAATPFFGTASVAAAPVALLVAAVLAVLAVAF